MKPVCSFCGFSPARTDLLLRGQDGNICPSCAESAFRLFSSQAPAKNKAHSALKPREITRYLDQYVVGEDKAKKALAVAVYNHYKRFYLSQEVASGGVEIEKSNVVLVGPTGTGKTYLARTLANCLDVPFCIVDATVLTEAGYVGEDVESIMTRLLQAADYDIERAQWGIVYIDEIDKISRKRDNPSITRDVGGEGVQQSLLKLMEGAEVLVPPRGGRKHPEQAMIKMDTRNVLFICGGAFSGIEPIIRARMHQNTLGFDVDTLPDVRKNNTLMSNLRSEDLRVYGLIPELVGRLPVVVHMTSLDEKALYRILVEPKNALLKQYKKLFALDKNKLLVRKEALQYIVQVASNYGLGARGLRSICEHVMLDFMYDMPSAKRKRKWVLTKQYVQRKLEEEIHLQAQVPA